MDTTFTDTILDIVAQDTITPLEVVDTLLHTADELLHSAPQDGDTQSWIYWGLAAATAVVGLLVYFKDKIIKKK